MQSLDNLCANAIRVVSADAIQRANSGHPGMVMGAAPMGYALYAKHLKIDPKPSRLAKPRPVCVVRRARQHAAVFPVAPVWFRPDDGRH